MTKGPSRGTSGDGISAGRRANYPPEVKRLGFLSLRDLPHSGIRLLIEGRNGATCRRLEKMV